MAGWLNSIAATWLDATLAAALIGGGTALAMIQCRQPARRRVWGRLGLAACLAVIPLVRLNPLPRIDLSRPPALWVVPHWDHPPAEPGPLRPAAGGDGPAGATGTIFRLVLPGLILAHAGGLAVALGRLGLGLLGARILLARSEPASTATEALLAGLPFDRPGGRRPTVRVSARLERPALLGLARPVILIPPGLDQPGVEEATRLALLHELAHAEIDDQRFVLLANLAHAVWFILPPVGWICRQLRLDAEFLADHRAVGSFGTSHKYAASLVGLAEFAAQRGTRPAGPPATTAQASGPRELGRPPAPAMRPGGLASALFQRVQMLLKCPFEVEDRVPPIWARLVAALVVVATLLASAVSVRPPNLAVDPPEEAGRRDLDLAELAIAPQRPEERPFDLRFRLPAEFTLTCEVLASPEELHSVEILGYPLGPDSGDAARPARPPCWHRVEIHRDADGDRVRVDDRPLDPPQSLDSPASTLTIRSTPRRLTRLRNLRLTW